MLDQTKTDLVKNVWNAYTARGERFINASEEFSHDELDKRRRQVIPEVRGWLDRFLRGETTLEEFKSAVDGINKRNRLWGFRGINGQMFFNILTKCSISGNHLADLNDLLKLALLAPADLAQARGRIDKFREFTRHMAQYSADPRGAPKVGSIPFFLTYFWQIQEPDTFPVYYSSMVKVLAELDVWSPSGDVVEDYVAFCDLNHELVEIFSREASHKLHLWDVEHAFWFHNQEQESTKVLETAAIIPALPSGNKTPVEISLPESYIPPVVSILPALAANDVQLAELCAQSGRSIEKVFEERLSVIFGMLGYEVESMGQGHGRAPDGIAISKEYHYAIVFDAKVRKEGYIMGTDDRAVKEYIVVASDRLRKQGIRHIYFMAVSSKFSGDHDDVIRALKIETDVREVLLVEASALLILLEGKLRNPNLTLGPDGIQSRWASSGLFTEADAREFVGI